MGGGSGGWGTGGRRRRKSKWGVGGGVGQQMVRHAARDVGCHGWGGSEGRRRRESGGRGWGQINGCGRGYFFPKVPAGMTRRVRVGVVMCV